MFGQPWDTGHLATKPLEVLAIDFTLFEPTTNGRDNILVMTELYTNFNLGVSTRDQRASTTAKVLLEEWTVLQVLCSVAIPLRPSEKFSKCSNHRTAQAL